MGKGRGQRDLQSSWPGVSVLEAQRAQVQLALKAVTPWGFEGTRSHLSFQGFSRGLSEEITGLSRSFQRKHLVETSKPKRMHF
jgi:hypothetical protein